MAKSFAEIINACKKPNTESLKQALTERSSLSEEESDFITYIAGFSHYEFAEKLFDEFGLLFIDDNSILFDSVNNKLYVKVLLNDQSLRLRSFALSQISETYHFPIFTSSIAWRNRDGSYISNIYNEVKNLNYSQYDEYISQHIIGLREDVLSYEIRRNGIDFVINLTTVSQRNTTVNLAGLLNKVCIGLFVNSPDDSPNLSIHNLRNSERIYPFLNKIKWYIVDRNLTEEVINFFEEIGTEYTLVSYRGDDYDYFHSLISDIEVFMMQHSKNL